MSGSPIFAHNIAFTLVCPSCEYPMHATDWQRGKNYAIWRCQSMRCALKDKPFKQTLPQVQLDEVEDER